MPPTRRKCYKSAFCEFVFFLSLVALVGNLTVNYWEQYVIQSNLSEIKTNLYTLKDTMNTIDVAYDLLYKQLQALADIAGEGHLKYNNMTKGDCNTPRHTILAEKLMQELQYQDTQDTNIEALTKIQAQEHPTQPSLKRDKNPVKSQSDLSYRLNAAADKIDENVGTTEFRNKKLQIPKVRGKTTQVMHNLNAGTITRNPLKSEGNGNDMAKPQIVNTSCNESFENNGSLNKPEYVTKDRQKYNQDCVAAVAAGSEYSIF